MAHEYSFESEKPRDATDLWVWLLRLLNPFTSVKSSKSGGGGARTRHSIAIHRTTFAVRLGFDPATNPATIFDDAISAFCLQCHGSIDWYTDRLTRELWLRRVYFTLSLALLALIPIVILWLTGASAGQALGGVTSDAQGATGAAAGQALGGVTSGAQGATGAAAPDTTIAQLTAVLTGLFAFHRGISAWLEKRQVVGRYWKAAAGLKEELYALESAWDASRIVTEADAEAFETELEEATERCRKIVSDETAEYFQSFSYPTIDLAATLKSAGTSALDIVGRHQHPDVEVVARKTEARTAVRVVESKIAEFSRLVRTLEDDMRTAQTAGNTTQYDKQRAARDSALDQLMSAHLEHASAMAELERP